MPRGGYWPEIKIWLGLFDGPFSLAQIVRWIRSQHKKAREETIRRILESRCINLPHSEASIDDDQPILVYLGEGQYDLFERTKYPQFAIQGPVRQARQRTLQATMEFAFRELGLEEAGTQVELAGRQIDLVGRLPTGQYAVFETKDTLSDRNAWDAVAGLRGTQTQLASSAGIANRRSFRSCSSEILSLRRCVSWSTWESVWLRQVLSQASSYAEGCHE